MGDTNPILNSNTSSPGKSRLDKNIVGEKKRYSYSNNPNPRHGSVLMNSYQKKNYQYSPSGNNISSASTVTVAPFNDGNKNNNYNSNSGNYSPSSPYSNQHSIQHNYSSSPNLHNMNNDNNTSKTSRYDPNSISRPSSSSRPIGSRYNPIEKQTQLPVQVQVQTHTTNDNNSGSRYSGSRYNPQSKSSANINSSHYSSSPLNSSSNPTNPHYTGNLRRHRPRSSEPNLIKNSQYYNQQQNLDANPNSISISNGTTNESTSYYSRNNSIIDISNANKWKPSHSPMTNTSPIATISMDNDNNIKLENWKSSRSNLSKNLTASYVAPSPRRYNPNPVAKLNQNTDAANDFESYSMNDDNQSNDEIPSNLPIESINLHSLGSSLINSFNHPTRKDESKRGSILEEKSIETPSSIPKLADNEKPQITTKRSSVSTTTKTSLAASEPTPFPSSAIKIPSSLNKISHDHLWSPSHEIEVEESEYNESKITQTNEKFDFKSLNASESVPLVKESDEKELKARRRTTTPLFMAEYEFEFDPIVLKTDMANVRAKLPKERGYSTPLVPIDGCIFPMNKSETRLWELRNQRRENIISNQKYLLKKPIKSINEYPFVKENILIYQQALKPLLTSAISKTKRYEYAHKFQLKKEFMGLQDKWKEECIVLDNISNELRAEELEQKRELEKEQQEKLQSEKELLEEQKRASGSSRRRNRADFVDDTEIESVLLQIDPDYKHHQTAAKIPAMIINPIEKYSIKFKDTNNLVTDKDKWSSRILTDGIDTFTEVEHELFVDSYLTYPKRFGKISNQMGGLRTPEDCVLHYYRTKGTVDYKKLIMEKNKKRKSGAVKKNRKKKDKINENGLENTSIADYDATDATETLEPEVFEKPGIDQENEEIKQDILVEEELDEETESLNPSLDENLKNNKSKETEATCEIPATATNPELEHTSNLPEPHEQKEESMFDEIVVEQSMEPMVSVQHIEIQENVQQRPELAPIVSSKRLISETEIKNESQLVGIQLVHTAENEYAPDFDHFNYSDKQDHNDPNQRKKVKHQPDHKSSYWSVKEANLFPDLLKEHGSQWSLISGALGTKSTTMVRNYYQRNAAQLGWKLLVEDADSKRNATSSGSVQQSQILIQAGQTQQPIIVQNGIPIQQKPALGFFSLQEGSDTRNRTGNINSSAQPFSAEVGNKDLFPSVQSPAMALPPPRLPSIQLGRPSIFDRSSAPGSRAVSSSDSSESQPSSGPTSVQPHIPIPQHNNIAPSAGARISDILNSTSLEPSMNKTIELPPIQPHPNHVIVQEPQLQISAPISSITSLLNSGLGATSPYQPLIMKNTQSTRHVPSSMRMDSNMANLSTTAPIISPDQSSSYQVQQQLPIPHTSFGSYQQSQTIPSFNFSTDPLAALAAIASAPETMASFLPSISSPSPTANAAQKTNNTNSNPPATGK